MTAAARPVERPVARETRILLVEDNANLARGLRRNLEIEGYAVSVAADGAQGLVAARRERPDLVLLDLMLPGIDGYGVLAGLRDEGIDAPVLLLTARQEEQDKVRGFRLGADDYVTKPFGLQELLARIGALLRRSERARAPEPAQPDYVRFGDVEVYPKRHLVLLRGRAVELRPKALELLFALVGRPGETISRHALLREVWGYRGDVLSRTVDTHMAELRRKLEDDPSRPAHLIGVRKVGYQLRP
ncbi:response regulator transcription factor [Roseisolibacter sp. H3M3-2]|uniref:response regulator transcription factor n=1 Tax=Roseisolibacter sp. H3M3-2 TaxID=3031323 RepID=UPI0023DC0E07|nr:response regulator transcription factor [Roseisolibacter sp. H3M3-2]MDF1503173.1 response regulator transcription factor [Roseisolibacter sp. H3M3-2]